MIFWPADAIQVKSLSSQKRLKKELKKEKLWWDLNPCFPDTRVVDFVKLILSWMSLCIT